VDLTLELLERLQPAEEVVLRRDANALEVVIAALDDSAVEMAPGDGEEDRPGKNLFERVHQQDPFMCAAAS
jgi:hypothetical protein